MRPPTRRAQLDKLDVLTAQLSPAGLAWVVGSRAQDPDDGWVPFRHLELLSEKLMALAAGDLRRLIVTMPPQHGKSELISRFTPAWFLGTHPDRKVMLASYEATYAKSWGRKAREVLEEYGETVFGVRVSQSSSAADFWEIKGHRGVMVTAGVGGALTGKGADLLVIDDPVKNAEESFSEVMREKAWDWWLSTARTRLQRRGGAVLVMTRWHEDDLAGRLLRHAEEGGDQWELLNLPAIAAKDDPIAREPGDPLCPELHDAASLAQTKQAVGPYFWSALYQQSPTPDEGGLFRRNDFQYFEIDGDLVVLRYAGGEKRRWGIDHCTKFQVCDLASSEKTSADYTVMAEIWVTPEKDMLVRSVYRDRVAVPDQPNFFEDHHAGGPVKFEAIGYQGGIVQTMLRRGFPAESVHPDSDKVTRAGVAGVLYRAGKVFHYRAAEWLADFEAELLAFPAGEHDDQVDAIAYAAKALPDLPGKRRRRQVAEPTGGLLAKDF